VFRAHAARGGPSLPKGISQETTDLVLKALEGADEEGLSATECAESTGLSRSSTRRYLEHLVSIGTA
jgi:response regulator of citrate/malate metabolism